MISLKRCERLEVGSQTLSQVSPEEYLALERVAEYKNEYCNGEVSRMPDITRWHSLIAGNLLSAVKHPEWEIHGSLMRLFVPARRLYTYPDVTIVCGDGRFEGLYEDVLLDPTVIVEVFPKSKFLQYQTIPSLREYLLVSQYERHVDLCTRLSDTDWRIESIDHTSGRVHLSSVGVELTFDQIYAGVTQA